MSGMDATGIAVAGIAGTLLGTLLAPLLAERMRRRSVRAERVHAQRLETYADLLRVTARMSDNAMTWSCAPIADREEPTSHELDHVMAQARMVSSSEVDRLTSEFGKAAHRFMALLLPAREDHRRRPDDEPVDRLRPMRLVQQRTQLGAVADEMRALFEQLVTAVRRDIGQ